jgi:phospholipid/cholesterol/gamma-HCH transport system substrate-binding protein
VIVAIKKNLADFLAIIGVVVLGLAIGAYVLANQRLRFPIVEKPFYTVKAELPDAQAVTPGQGQTVVTAGVRIGDIGSVDLEDGHAVVTLQIEPKYKGMIREDATALLRAKTGTKDMFLEVDPGDGKPLPENGHIEISNTLPDIDPDEFLAVLDSDTRNYLKLLISGAGKGLDHRGTDLREVLRRLGPVHRDIARVSKAVAERRHNMRRLVNRYGLLMTELGNSDKDITRLVRASNVTLGAFADEDQNISSLVSKLPGTLNQTASTLGKVNVLSQEMRPTFEALRPPFRKLDDANEAVLPFVKEAAPILKNQIRPFARAAQPFQKNLGGAAKNLRKANPSLTAAFHELNRLFDMGAYNPNGSEGISEGCEKAGACTPKERSRNEGYLYWLAWVGQNTNSLFSSADALGPIRRAYLLNLNCAVFTQGARQVGMPPAEADGLTHLFGALGACSAP